MKYPLLAASAAATLALAGCATGFDRPTAVAELQPTAANQVRGSVRFEERGGGVRVAGEVRGLRPNSEHGFHVHEKGDCSSPDASSAGGHFNPAGTPHGHFARTPHHAGDMPNLQADGAGVARIDVLVPALRVSEGATSVVGRGLVVHREPDDYRSQPAGESGPRVACAVIRRG
ncbi:superoxide dismutase family protein [Ramlibacter sp. AN1015]|uniref:superoxide dismutase family protein n=1 Tax=Ramlibacter sp. AN1015 TaxID=3133428 RepID=UPI0030C029EF